jgi:hypothetical protein
MLVKYLTPALWNDRLPRENLNLKYSTRIYLQYLLPVSLTYSFADLGNIDVMPNSERGT